MAFTAGQKLRASDLSLPVCVARQTTVQSINPNAWVPLTFQVADYDPDGLFNAASPTRVTVQRKGLYRVSAVAPFTVAATIRIGCQIQKNGAAVPMGTLNLPAGSLAAGGVAPTPPGLLLQLAAGDYVSAAAVHTHSAALNTIVVADTAAFLSVQCVSLLP